VRVLAHGAPPAEYVPRRSGFGAGTKDFVGRANALRLVLADAPMHAAATDFPPHGELLMVLAADLDDASPEYVADAADTLRAAGALDVWTLSVGMKKGRMGLRLEVLAQPADADALERCILRATPTLGVRRHSVERRALARRTVTVDVDAHPIRLKVADVPGGAERVKPEYDDVRRAAAALGRPARDVHDAALAAARIGPAPGAADVRGMGETASGEAT
jgi:uncharacterized protein (DUF111 family)